MTNKELIEKLQKLPPDMPVWFGTPRGDLTRVLHVDIAAADEGEVVYVEIDHG